MLFINTFFTKSQHTLIKNILFSPRFLTQGCLGIAKTEIIPFFLREVLYLKERNLGR